MSDAIGGINIMKKFELSRFNKFFKEEIIENE